METLQLPVLEETPEEQPTATCAEEPIDLAAVDLWRQASRPEEGEESK